MPFQKSSIVLFIFTFLWLTVPSQSDSTYPVSSETPQVQSTVTPVETTVSREVISSPSDDIQPITDNEGPNDDLGYISNGLNGSPSAQNVSATETPALEATPVSSETTQITATALLVSTTPSTPIALVSPIPTGTIVNNNPLSMETSTETPIDNNFQPTNTPSSLSTNN